MSFLEIIFLAGIFIVSYSYIGYGILLWVIVKLRELVSGKGRQEHDQEFLPLVTLIVAAYNEQDFISEKIKNTLDLDYPENRLNIIFITDGSVDETPSVIRSFPRIQLLHEPERKGKVAAMHRAMEYVVTPYVIFSDANTLLNRDCVRNIVRHYKDEKVGGVAGEKKVMQLSGSASGAGEGLYWKYESLLKQLDWDFYTVVGAAGELFSVKTDLYEHPGNNVILDDLIISLNVCRKGFRVAYEPRAFANETPSSSMREEQKRKIRISAGAFQSMWLMKDLLNVFKFPKVSFQFISHRVLRWTLCPLLLPLIFIFNIILVINDQGLFYNVLLALQLLFYSLALAGWLLSLKNLRIGILYAPYYFLFINLSLYLGFIRFLKGKQTVIWEKASRMEYSGEKAI